MSSNKRAGGSLLANMVTTAKKNRKNPNPLDAYNSNNTPKNPYLSRPVLQEQAIYIFLVQARSTARSKCNLNQQQSGGKKPNCEIEARIGILKSTFGLHDQRVLSSGAKRVNVQGTNRVFHAFDCTPNPSPTNPNPSMNIFEGGVTRTHFVNWTGSGLSEVSPVSHAFGVKDGNILKRDLVEKEMVETVFSGYSNHNRVCYDGDHLSSTKSSSSSSSSNRMIGKMENKTKLTTMDLALPASPYDLRINLSTEEIVDSNVPNPPPQGWTSKRLKRRKSYFRKDSSIKWQLDVTEVISTTQSGTTDIGYEIEFELNPTTTSNLINEKDERKARDLCKKLAQQLHWMVSQINPISNVLDVEEFIVNHPNPKAVQLALAQCGCLKSFMDSRRSNGGGSTNGGGTWQSAIVESGESPTPPAKLANIKFPGCMPVNFQRHNIEEVQRSDGEHGYFLSEKTDGVRHFMVFTGDTVVLVDRAMEGKTIDVGYSSKKGQNGGSKDDPMKHILPLIKPGTVLDGEVVMRRSKPQRPVFIVFDVLSLSTTQPILHLPFAQRLMHLRKASFRTQNANRDMFAESDVMNPEIPLPLVRKNFVKRMELDSLISNVVEEKGLRSYKNGIHDHLTDGIIFQPNLPYVCGTDIHLLKWKYLDTVTIDVQIMPGPLNNYHLNNDNDDTLHVGVTGEDGTMVDMTRFIRLPSSERRRLEADRAENGAKIAEVGFEPTTGEWYYLTMRPDKIAPNHISTVLGTLLELAESLSTEELRYRMSVPPSGRDTYRKDMRNMQKQLLDHQRKKNLALKQRK